MKKKTKNKGERWVLVLRSGQRIKIWTAVIGELKSQNSCSLAVKKKKADLLEAF